MKKEEQSKKEKFVDLLAAYADDTLSGDEKGHVETFLAENPGAERLVDAQKISRDLVSAHARSEVKAPVYLRTRILDAIGHEASLGFFGRLRLVIAGFRLTPAPSLTLAGATIALAIFAITAPFLNVGSMSSPSEVTFSGVVQCVDCTLENRLLPAGLMKHGGDDMHRNGLVLSSGQIWTFANDRSDTSLVRDPSFHGKEITVRGYAVPQSQYIHVSSYTLADNGNNKDVELALR